MFTRSKSRFSDLMLVSIVVIMIAGIAHFVITNPLGPSRLLYYGQVPLIQWNTRCSTGAPEWMSDLQRYSTSRMAAPASQLAYIAPDGELHHCETGWKDGVFGEHYLMPEARFRFASTTKTVTAAAIIDLVNQGQLALSDTVVEVLGLQGEPKDPRVADISIRHLLSHRGGWDRERAQDAMFMMNHDPWCPGSPEKLLDSGLMYTPGEVELYSNLGYCLLGLVIEHVAGQRYQEYIAERYDFGNSTLSFLEGPFFSDEVKYDFRFENFYNENYHEKFDFPSLASSAGLSGSASDLAQLISGALDSQPLTILSGDMMHDCNPAEIQNCYGYGVYRYQPSKVDMPLYIHGGKLPGSPAAIVVDPHGGVLVWVGAGGPRPGDNATQIFYDEIREVLSVYYGDQSAPKNI